MQCKIYIYKVNRYLLFTLFMMLHLPVTMIEFVVNNINNKTFNKKLKT